MQSYSKIIWNILNTNFMSSLIGGFLVAVAFWYFFEKRLTNVLNNRENKDVAKEFLEEILYNRIIAEQVVKEEEKYLTSTTFTFLKYETGRIDKFLEIKPLNIDRKFYASLRTLNAVAFKKNNMLVDIFWFTPQSTDKDRTDYKTVFVNNAKNNLKNIDDILTNESFISEMERFRLTDDKNKLD